MLFPLLAIVSIAALCNAATMSMEQAQKGVKAQFSKELEALAIEGFATRKSANLRSTLAEYASSGFVSVVASYESNCNKAATTVGFVANVCTLTDSFAYKFLLSADSDSCEGAVIEYFGDEKCTESLGTSDLTEGDLSCKQDAEGEGLTPGMTSYKKVTCSKYASPVLAATSAVMDNFANTTDCAEGSFDSYIAFSDGSCVALSDNSARLDCSGEGEVIWNHFSSLTDCTGDALFVETITDTCDFEEVVDDDYYTDDSDDRHIFNPPPSVSTTPFPTAAPDNSTVYASTRWQCVPPSSVVTLKITQNVDGFSLDTFNEDPELYTMTFKQAIAATMDGVSSSDITEFTVTDASPAARLVPTVVRSALRPVVSRLLTAGDSVTLSYTVTVATSVPAAELSDQLSAAVSDGTFNDLLHEYATANGATALTTATSDSVDVTVVKSSDKKETITKGGIAGIVVGGFVGICLIIIGAVLYKQLFLSSYAPAPASPAVVEVPSVSA